MPPLQPRPDQLGQAHAETVGLATNGEHGSRANKDGLRENPSSPNTVHLSILMAFLMLIGGSGLSVRRRRGKLLIFRLTPRMLRR